MNLIRFCFLALIIGFIAGRTGVKIKTHHRRCA